MESSANKTVLGLALVALGCVDAPGAMDTGESGSGDDSSGDGVPTGDGDGDTSGDGDGDPSSDGFELVSAELDVAGQVVTLHFSKPVAPVDAVEPDDFRISHAFPAVVVGEAARYDYATHYWDANNFVAWISYPLYDPPSTALFEVTSMSLGEDAHDVRLQFGMPLDPGFCDYVTTYLVNYPDRVGLLVHHAPGHIPLTSVDGEPLEAIGPEWVAEQFPAMSVPGEFLANLDPRIEIEIPCP